MYSLGTIFPTEERKEEVVSVWTGGEKGEAAVWGVGPQGGSVRLQVPQKSDFLYIIYFFPPSLFFLDPATPGGSLGNGFKDSEKRN